MGKAARNHGGTGGHGVFPMIGESPNYNWHVMSDRALLGLVSNNDRSQQKVSLKLSMTGVADSLPNSYKAKRLNEERLQQAQPVRSISQQYTSVNQPVASVNQPVASVKKPVASVKQPVTSTPGQDALQEQQTLLPNKPLIHSVPETVIKAQLPGSKIATVTAVKPTVTSPLLQEHQTLSSDQSLINSGQKPVIKAQLPVTKFQPSVTSTQHSVTSVKQPVTAFKLPMTSSPSQDILQEQQILSSDQSLMNSGQKSVIKAQLPVTEFQHSVTSPQHNVTSVKQPVTPVKLPVQSAPGLQTLQEPQTFSSDQFLISSGQKSVIKAHMPEPELQHSVTSTQHKKLLVKQTVASIPWAVKPVSQLGFSYVQPILVAPVPTYFSVNTFNPPFQMPFSYPAHNSFYLVSNNHSELISVPPQLANQPIPDYGHWIPEHHQNEVLSSWMGSLED